MGFTDVTAEINNDDQNSIVAEKADIIRRNKIILDAIRRCHSDDKSFIAKTANVSWPTVNTFLSKYTGETQIVINDGTAYRMNLDYALFLGVAVGARETKVTLVTLDFDGITEEFLKKHHLKDFFNILRGFDDLHPKKSEQYLDYCETMVCYETKNDLDYISRMCNKIIRSAINYFSGHEKLNLLGIGLTFPGIISKEDLQINFCPNINCLNNVYVLNLLHEDIIVEMNRQSISLCIAHDTAAITVFEKENLYKSDIHHIHQDKENIVCLYLGMGLGCGIIINNQLLSGKTNSIGEIGHIPAPPIDEKLLEKQDTVITSLCHCKEDNCLEKAIRVHVFGASTPEQLIQTTTLEYLQDFHIKYPDRYEIFKHYLRYIFTIIIDFFNPDLIILSGRILNSMTELKTDAYMLKQSSGISLPAANCCILNGSDRPDCVAIGAGILAYYKLIESNQRNDVSGMNFNVRWNKK